jgi:hypothetical protein
MQILWVTERLCYARLVETDRMLAYKISADEVMEAEPTKFRSFTR